MITLVVTSSSLSMDICHNLSMVWRDLRETLPAVHLLPRGHNGITASQICGDRCRMLLSQVTVRPRLWGYCQSPLHFVELPLLGSRREFSPFVNQLGKIAYGLTSYIDQSIYESTSPYINSLYDWIRGTVSYPQNSRLPRRRPSPQPIHHHHPSPSPAGHSADW